MHEARLARVLEGGAGVLAHERLQLELYIDNHTRVDGSDLGQHLSNLFEVLNTPSGKRLKNLEEDIADFPFVNGELFADRLAPSAFNRDMRDRLVAACRFDWSRISPAIFGSLFQGIMDAKERRQIGAHYTSERDILKLKGNIQWVGKLSELREWRKHD